MRRYRCLLPQDKSGSQQALGMILKYHHKETHKYFDVTSLLGTGKFKVGIKVFEFFSFSPNYIKILVTKKL